MAERMRVVIAERKRPLMAAGPEHVIYHLPAGPDVDEGWWMPIRCGGGIALHGGTERVPQSMVCKECASARTETGEQAALQFLRRPAAGEQSDK